MVFDYFPYLQGRYLTYEEYFALLLFLYTLLPALSFLTVGCLLGQCKGSNTHNEAEVRRWEKWVTWGQEVCYWVGAMGMTLAIDVGSMFDWMAVQTTIFLSLLTLLTRLLLWCSRVSH